MKSILKFSKHLFILLLLVNVVLFFSGCGEDPVKEDAPELITKAKLTFTPLAGGNAIEVSATDPDGEGVQDIKADGPILLTKDKFYSLNITLLNELAQPTSPEYDLTAEVEEEGEEHMFFFAWTSNLFSSPSGDGNIDNRNHEVNYQDSDGTNPIGLQTNWQTISTTGAGTFRILLKHQPDLKSTTSSSSDGETDLDLTFNLVVQ